MSQRLEQTYPPGTVEVLNFGVSGYCTLAEVELLETRGLRFEADQVVLVFVENDFDNFNRETFQLGSGRERPALARAALSRLPGFDAVVVVWPVFRFAVVAWRRSWSEDRVYFEHDRKKLRSLPSRWTSLVAADPSLALAAGRAHFRVADLRPRH